MKPKMLGIFLQSAPPIIFGSALYFGTEATTSLAIVWAWLMIALGLFALLCVVFVRLAAEMLEGEQKQKAKKCLADMRAEIKKRRWLKWPLFALNVTFLALSGITVTAIMYAVTSLFCQVMLVLLLASLDENTTEDK